MAHELKSSGGPCKIKLIDESGEIIEVEGSYGWINGVPTLTINVTDNNIPHPNYQVVEVIPITPSG